MTLSKKKKRLLLKPFVVWFSKLAEIGVGIGLCIGKSLVHAKVASHWPRWILLSRLLKTRCAGVPLGRYCMDETKWPAEHYVSTDAARYEAAMAGVAA